jgi:hypothetical protein
MRVTTAARSGASGWFVWVSADVGPLSGPTSCPNDDNRGVVVPAENALAWILPAALAGVSPGRRVPGVASPGENGEVRIVGVDVVVDPVRRQFVPVLVVAQCGSGWVD